MGVPPPSGVTTSLVNSTAMSVLLPLLLMLLPPLGLPLARLPPPPFSLRFWVLQRILCFLPLLVFRGVIPVSLTPPLAVGSARSSCCSRFVCFCAFFPLTLTVTPSVSLLLILFLFFLPPAVLMSPSLPLPCCGRRLSSLYGWFVAGLPSSSGHPVTGVLLQRLASWALQCYFTLCRQCQIH